MPKCQCPNCQAPIEISGYSVCRVFLDKNGQYLSAEDHDVDWDANAEASCTAGCGWEGLLTETWTDDWQDAPPTTDTETV